MSLSLIRLILFFLSKNFNLSSIDLIHFIFLFHQAILLSSFSFVVILKQLVALIVVVPLRQHLVSSVSSVTFLKLLDSINGCFVSSQQTVPFLVSCYL